MQVKPIGVQAQPIAVRIKETGVRAKNIRVRLKKAENPFYNAAVHQKATVLRAVSPSPRRLSGGRFVHRFRLALDRNIKKNRDAEQLGTIVKRDDGAAFRLLQTASITRVKSRVKIPSVYRGSNAVHAFL